MQIFKWNAEKNKTLADTRGITFDEIVQQIHAGALICEAPHPNKNKYPDQTILIIEINNYAYLVPCVISGDEYFLKTIIPSRKATKQYLREQS
jgi:uncharacterized DUF497 family protein